MPTGPVRSRWDPSSPTGQRCLACRGESGTRAVASLAPPAGHVQVASVAARAGATAVDLTTVRLAAVATVVPVTPKGYS